MSDLKNIAEDAEDVSAAVPDEPAARLEDVNRLLQSVQCGDLVNSGNAGKPVSIPLDSSIFDSAGILAKSAITAAPVIDSSSGKVQGMFDYDDLAALVLAAFQKDSASRASLTEEHLDLAKFLSDSHIGNLGNVSVQTVADLSKNKPAVIVQKSAHLSTAVKHFKKGKRRCVVVDDEEKFVGMLSQSDVVKFFHGAVKKKLDDAASVEKLLNKTLEELGIGHKSVATINENKSVLDALQEMYRLGISGIPIVDSTGSISGSISIKDLKYAFAMQWFQVLEHSCRNYIASARRQQTMKDQGARDVSPVISVGPNTKLSMVIESLVATKTHRMWVVENRKPVGVVSLADIIKVLCS